MTLAVSLLQTLLRFKSVTPDDAGTMAFIQAFLEPFGFDCHVVQHGDVTNFYARRGVSSPHLCFLGHTDVVPAPDPLQWKHDPFGGVVDGDIIYGRGAVDMKGAIACFLSAIADTTESCGSVSLLLTSDEEGRAENGVKKMIPWLQARGEQIDFCLGGEPTNPCALGEMMKVGRRGSLTMKVCIKGSAGHVAYPNFALNPISPMVALCQHFITHPFDEGDDLFDPTHLEVTSIDVGNPTSNMIPQQASATLNVRFCPHYTLATLKAALLNIMDVIKKQYNEAFVWEYMFFETGEAFYNHHAGFAACVREAVQAVLGVTPVCSTTGGTSDARFMKALCPVVEFGLLSNRAHQVNESITIRDLDNLTQIYRKIIENVLSI